MKKSAMVATAALVAATSVLLLGTAAYAFAAAIHNPDAAYWWDGMMGALGDSDAWAGMDGLYLHVREPTYGADASGRAASYAITGTSDGYVAYGPGRAGGGTDSGAYGDGGIQAGWPVPLSKAVYVSSSGQHLPEITHTATSGASTFHKAVSVAPVLTGLTAPWDVAFGDNGWVYVSTRPGVLYGVYEGNMTELLRLRVSGGEGGMLGIATLGDMLYVYHTDPEKGNKISRYVHGESGLSFNATIMENIPGGAYHDGGRIRFGPDSMLYVTTGDAGRNVNSWNPQSLAGKILRINPDGSIPAGNPFPDSPVYAYGLRNPQGLAWDNTGALYATDHGASGQDEINRIKRGGNYGWPFSRGDTVLPDTVPPLIHSGNDTWAPSGLVYAGAGTPVGGMLLYGALRGEHLGVVRTDGTGHSVWFAGELGRIRTPIQHPNGTLYLLTSNTDGRGTPNAGDDKLLRIVFEDPVKARVVASAPTAGQDIVVTVTLDAAAPADSQFLVQLHPCDQGRAGYINSLKLCPGGETITYDDIIPTHASEPEYHGGPTVSHYAGSVTIKNGTTAGTLSFGTAHDSDEGQESLIVSVTPRLDGNGDHPFYSPYDLLRLAWVDTSAPFVGEAHGFALWETSILPSPDPPRVVSISGVVSLTEDDDVTFFVDAKPPPSSPLDVNFTVTQVGGFVNSSYVGSQTVTVPTNGTASVTLPVTDNNIVDEPDGIVTITLNEGPGYVLSSSQRVLSVDVLNDDDGKPVSVSLKTQKTSILAGGMGTNFTIKLDRPLEPGESVTVPFTVGGGTTPEHWSVELVCHSPFNTRLCPGGTTPEHRPIGPEGGGKGVELTSSGAKFEARFAEGARTATLLLAANQSSDAVGRTITVSLGPPTSAGVEGGVMLGGAASFAVNITGVYKPAPAISVRGDNPVYISEGEQYVDAGATCTDYDKRPVTPAVDGSVDTLVLGTYVISYSCADDAGKESSASRTVVVQDVTPPSLVMPDASAEATGPSTPVGLGFPTIQDASGGPYTVTHNATGAPTVVTSGPSVPLAVGSHIVVQWNATDASGNTGTTHQTVSVADTTPPTLSIPDASAEATGPSTPVGLGFPAIRDASGGPYTVTHNATGAPTVVTSGPSVPLAVGSHIVVQWNATDASGNTGTTHQTVSVADTTPPTLTLNGKASVSITVGGKYADAGATCTDSVDGTLVPVMRGGVDASSVGSYAVQYACSDTQNNAAAPISRTVYVLDAAPLANQTAIVRDGDDRPVSVSLAAQKTSILESGGKTKLKVTLSRPLGPGEAVSVPLDVRGGEAREHWSIKLGGGSKGVEYAGAKSEVRFAQGAQKAVFVLAAKPNSDTVDRTVTVSLGHPASSGVAGGVMLGGGGSFAIDIIDDDKPVSVSLAAQKASVLENKGKTEFTIELSRPLGPGEAVSVPLDVRGGEAREHWSIKLGGGSKGVEYAGAKSEVRFAQGAQKAVFVLAAKPNSDTVDRTVTVSLGHPASSGVAGGVMLGGGGSFAIDIIDDEKYVSVSLAAQKASILENGGKTKLKVTLGRPLGPGETVGVAFDVNGGIAYDHWSIGLRDNKGAKQVADAGKSELWYAEDGSLYAAVLMDGVHGATSWVKFTEGERTATFLLTSKPNSDTGDRTLTVSLDRLTSSGIEQGVILGGDKSFVCGFSCDLGGLVDAGFQLDSDTSFEIYIIDGDKPAPAISVRGDNPVYISEGEQYVDAGATCTDYDKRPVTPAVDGSVDTLVLGTYVISYSCADDAGKESSASRTVVVRDVTPPSLVMPDASAEATGPSTPVGLGFPAIRDASGGPYTVTHNATGAPTVVTSGPSVPLAVGSHVVQWNATDASGNTGTTHQTVSVADTTPPTLTLNGKALIYIFVEDTYTDAGATCTDSVDGVLKPVVQSNLDMSSAGQYTVQYTCSDTSDNAAAPVSRTVSVDDATPPTLSIPDASAEATGPSTPVGLGFPTIQDASGGPYIVTHNATGAPTVVTSGPSVPLAVGSHIVVQWNATDASGNTGTTHQTVSVADTTPPTLSIPDASAEATGPSTPVGLGFPAIRDASGGPYTVTHNATGAPTVVTSGPSVPLAVGSRVVQWNATDASGNTGTTHQTVSVADTTPPTLTLNGKATISIPMGGTYADAGATCTDSVDGSIKPAVNGSVNSSVLGTYAVTYTCTDTAENSAAPVTRTIQLTLPTIVPTAFVAGNVAATEGDSLDFVISLSHPYAYAVDVYYITIDAGANAGSDYVFANDLVRFDPGQTTHTVSIETTADDIQEGDESVRFELVDAYNAKISEGQWLAVGTISDS